MTLKRVKYISSMRWSFVKWVCQELMYVINFPNSWPHQDLLSRNIRGLGNENVPTPKGVSSALVRLSDCFGPDRDSCHLGTLSIIIQHFTRNETHTANPNPVKLTENPCKSIPTGKDLYSLQGTPVLIAGSLFSLQGFPCISLYLPVRDCSAVTYCCSPMSLSGMYPAGKVDIFQHLAIPRFPQSDYTISKPSADSGSLCSKA